MVTLDSHHYRAVLDAMRQAGCAPSDPDVIVFDGIRHRFHVDGDPPGRRNGWLILYADGCPAGAFGSWKTGRSATWHAQWDAEGLPADDRAWRQHWAAVDRRRREEARERHAQARTRAMTLWERSRSPVEVRHPYLLKKQVPAIGLRQLHTVLVAPLRDEDGVLHSLAFIDPAGNKRFLKDGAVVGHGQVLGALPGAHRMVLCEGYATGASVHLASGWPVVVCFSAGNLEPVGRRLRARYPDALLVFAADDDRATADNPGRTHAEQAARAVDGRVLLPNFTGLVTPHRLTDFNDLQVHGGFSSLRTQVMANLEALVNAQPLKSWPPRSPTGGGGQCPDGALDASVAPSKARLAMARAERSGHRRGAARGGRQDQPGDGGSGHRRGRGGASRNLYQEVTDQIIAMIENGTAPWQRPWDRPRHPQAPTRPLNAATGQFYNGINILLLQANPLSYDDPRWCGYEQAKARGWQVKAGAHGTSIYFFKRLEIDETTGPDGEPLLDENGKPMTRTIPLLRPHTVFHASQIEGIPSLEEAYGSIEALPDHVWDALAPLETLLQRSGARIVHQGVQAFYRPNEDCIYLPPPERFPNSGRYYGVAFHELGHWTGHPDRLHRPFHFDRHAPEYAREELRAELASAFLGAELGLQHDLEAHAAYLDLYLDLLRQDNREIFRAARDAQGIADLILDRHPTWQLRQGVCVARSDPLAEEALMPDAGAEQPVAHPLPEPLPASNLADAPNATESTVHPAALAGSGIARPYRWAAAALDELDNRYRDCVDPDEGGLERLSRQIDAALPLRAAVGEMSARLEGSSRASAPRYAYPSFRRGFDPCH